MTRSTIPAATMFPDAMLGRIANNVGLHFFRHRLAISFRFQVPNEVTK